MAEQLSVLPDPELPGGVHASAGTERRVAVFDPSAPHLRYTLLRWWGDGEPDLSRCWAWIGLNPSTADGLDDDPTMRRIRRFTRERSNGEADGFVMLNLWALRSPHPRDLGRARRTGVDHTGANLDVIEAVATRCARVVACWGAHAHSAQWRVARVGEVVGRLHLHGVGLHALRPEWGVSLVRYPPHPLYRPATDRVDPWGWAP